MRQICSTVFRPFFLIMLFLAFSLIFSHNAWADHRRAVVANFGGNSVTIFNLATGLGNTITNISDPQCGFNGPRWVAITQNGRFAGVTNSGSNTVTWIDLQPSPQGSPPDCLGTTSVGTNPKGIAIHGNKVAVVAVDDPLLSDSVNVIDISGLPTIPGAGTSLALGAGTNPEGVAITPNGDFALVALTGANAIAYVNLTVTPAVLLGGTTAVGNFPFDVAVTEHNDTALVTNRNDDTLSVVDIHNLPNVGLVVVTHTIAVGESPRGVEISPDGDRAVIAETGSARILELEGFQSLAIPHGTDALFGVATFTASSKAAVTNEDDNSVSIFDLDADPIVVQNVGVGAQPQGIAVTPNQLPNGQLQVTPTRGKEPLTVTLDASNSSDSDGEIRSCTYHFGDGTSETNSCGPVTHVYNLPGGYETSVIVTDDDGGVDNVLGPDVLVARNNQPRPKFSTKAVNGQPRTFQFTDQSSDDGKIVTWLWTFGDGGTSIERNPRHTYAAAGTFQITLTVTDDNGAKATGKGKLQIR